MEREECHKAICSAHQELDRRECREAIYNAYQELSTKGGCIDATNTALELFENCIDKYMPYEVVTEE